MDILILSSNGDAFWVSAMAIHRVNYPGKLGLQQRVLAAYRVPFFEHLAQACEGGLSVCAGQPRPEEAIAVASQLQSAKTVPLRNIHILKGRFYLCYQGGLLDWLKNWSPDALIVEANPRYLSTPAAVRWMKDRQRPVIGWGLGAPPLVGPLADLRKTRRISFLRHFDALITYSRQGAEEYSALGFQVSKIFVAPNAAVPRPSQPLPARPAGFAGKPNALFIGRLQARKRVDLLLQACAALPASLQPGLVIVGDGPERKALETLARTVYPSAVFAGARHGSELEPYFSAADLFVLPGTGGLAVQEAMSHGLPIIMGEGDGTNNDLVRPENGWRIPPNDLGALIETLQLALVDVVRLRKMGSESFRIVIQEINLEIMAGVFVEALNSVK
jgi:glycosyltransferase involved in cell wall biosynthesis